MVSFRCFGGSGGFGGFGGFVSVFRVLAHAHYFRVVADAKIIPQECFKNIASGNLIWTYSHCWNIINKKKTIQPSCFRNDFSMFQQNAVLKRDRDAERERTQLPPLEKRS